MTHFAWNAENWRVDSVDTIQFCHFQIYFDKTWR